MKVRVFNAVLRGQDNGSGCALKLPFDPKEAYGKARAPVKVSVNDQPPFTTTVAVYEGSGWIGLRKAQRAEFGVDIGDTVQIRIQPDTERRTVDVPAELAAALEERPDARARYQAMSHSHRKRYADWVAEARRQDTRDRRAAKTVQMLTMDPTAS